MPASLFEIVVCAGRARAHARSECDFCDFSSFEDQARTAGFLLATMNIVNIRMGWTRSLALIGQ